MYLLIQNTSVAPIESFTVLGVSTARGNAEKIGQFGSGAKHGINLLLRNGINPIIFLGNKELKFFCKPSFMGDKQYNLVCYSYDGQVEKTGFSLEFGELDWDNIGMAIREIISNAIDAVGTDNVVVDVVPDCKPYSDNTSVYIPLTQEINKYYLELHKHFLHFNKKDDVSVLEKEEVSEPSFYRKGVFVRQFKEKGYSLFNYNFDDSIKIDESRNMSEGSCYSGAAKILENNPDKLAKYIETLSDTTQKYWEDNIGYYYFSNKTIANAWKSAFGDAIPCDNEVIAKLVSKKGYKVILVRNIELLRYSGIECAEKYITKVEENGYTVREANTETIKNLNKVWRKLSAIGLTNGKPKPQVKNFSGVAQNGEITRGYYKDGVIYINLDDQGSFQTILEECAHYITGACDGSRDFQEFAFNVACRLVSQWN